MRHPRNLGRPLLTLLVLALVVSLVVPQASAQPPRTSGIASDASSTNPAVDNFSAAIGRLVTLAAAAGGGLLSLVWARVALSWFSHDSMKKVLAKERARDALIGTLLFVGAVSGLVWALANWVVTGT
ncbi:MAG: hypothetical protein WCB18_02070 [Thermoplasmata archaeon]